MIKLNPSTSDSIHPLRRLHGAEDDGLYKSPRPLLDRLSEASASAVITFGGQGIGYMDELGALWADGGLGRALIERSAEVLMEVSQDRVLAWSGFLSQGVDLLQWLNAPETCPDDIYLSSSCLSQPLIFTTQIARFANIWERGLRAAFEANTIVGLTGHSQGIMAATLVSESLQGEIDPERFATYVRYFCWQGYHMACSSPPPQQDGRCMAAVSRISLSKLQEVVDRVNRLLPEADRLTISLQNTRTRNVISGHPKPLQAVREALDQLTAREQGLKKMGKFGGTPLDYTWEDLPVSAPFHSPHMSRGLIRMRESLKMLDFSVQTERLHIPVSLCDGTGTLEGDATEALIQSQFMNPVCWQKTLLGITKDLKVTSLLDMGPSDAVARLSMSSLRGTGVIVHPLSIPSGRRALLEPSEVTPPVQYAQFFPTLVTLPNGNIIINNRYTRLTGESPIILPGMTPTTVDAPIVAAGANAGFTSELAGGGQVTEPMFRARMSELSERLRPGAEVIFNALYLDPYLWGLHVKKTGIVQKLKREGAPLKGLTISAGIPELEEASTLLEELEQLGLWHNAFKPGNSAQVKRVCQIAEANPDKVIYVHLEGGKAGGHHSWEDLDQLLLDNYHVLRSQENIVLCVGGGIATESRAIELITGAWSEIYGLPVMPVDAIFLGTVTMAVKEATATPSVKRALAEISGSDQWVFAGDVGGGVTSGKSQLNADIHYIDNAASQCGRLLDEVAGDAEAIEGRRVEIISALNRTCKPYFGDLAQMTYAQVAERMIDLMAVGSSTVYEDGIWPDRSYRDRVADFIQRAEERLCSLQEGTFASVLRSRAELDDPHVVLSHFRSSYPNADTVRLHPIDAEHFIYKVCARPGKPVNFVPVIDQDVRRWYKSDSLWQAQSDHYTADQVLVIPGPEAVKGISSVDEPVADLLGRFESALVRQLQDQGAEAPSIEGHWTLNSRALPPEVTVERASEVTTLSIGAPLSKSVWYTALAGHLRGALVGLISTPRVFQGLQSIENPIQALCPPLKGSSLSCRVDDHNTVTHATYTSPEGEEVALTLGDDGRQITAVAKPRLVQLHPDEATQLTLTFELVISERSTHFMLNREGYDAAIAQFYQESLFGKRLNAPPVFETVTESVIADEQLTRAYHAVTGGIADDQVALNMGFSLVWAPIFTSMSAQELSHGMLRLVHLSNAFEVHSGWPVRAGERVEASARVSRVENGGHGRTIHTVAQLHREGLPCLTVRSAFFVRASFANEELALKSQELKRWRLDAPSAVELDVLSAQPFIHMNSEASLSTDLPLEVDVTLTERHPRVGLSRYRAQGILRQQDVIVATLSGLWERDPLGHPVATLFDTIVNSASLEVPTARQTLAHRRDRTPREMRAFSEIGLDRNSIHVSRLMARLGALDDVIVHGMWISARAHAFLVNDVLAGEQGRVLSFKVEFLAPALLNEAIEMKAHRVASIEGDMLIEIQIKALRDSGAVILMSATARVRSLRVAYVFPGQGIQQKGMGMEAYATSKAARGIWDRADTFTRHQLGFSILQIVRDNPKEVVVNGISQIHEQGVIHLTQFTQVAMAVLSQAHVAQLREASVLSDDAIVCGHSIGEYNAIGALGDILSFETIVQAVYERGLEMHRLVKRDERGESGYRMGVIRPHYAQLDEAGAEALVKRVAEETGLPLQIVNYNIMGRQYSVVGKIEAIRVLEEALLATAPPESKAPYLEVPGIDIPFHSRILVEGVPQFRATLERRFPEIIPVERLIGRYIPNLVPRLFSLERAYIQEIVDYTRSEPLQRVLEDWTRYSADRNTLGRIVFIELLAWQFASPVRWVETQALLLNRVDAGGVGIDQIIEIGVGYQPTLANMARYSKTLLYATARDVEIYNIETDADEVFYRVGDPEETVDEEALTAEALVEASPASTPAPSISATPPPPSLASTETLSAIEDSPLPIEEALMGLLALQAKVTPDQISLTETIDELFEGVSSRRNQVLLDIGAEFNLGTIDGAHEQPLQQLIGEIQRRSAQYKGPGKYLRVAMDEALKRVLGRTGVSRKEAHDYLTIHFALGSGLSEATLLTLILGTREGDSSRGGTLATLSAVTPTSKEDAQGLLDQATQALATKRGTAFPKKGAGGSSAEASVSAEVVGALEDKILGERGALMQVADALTAQLGHERPRGAGLSSPNVSLERLDRFIAEHSTAYEELIQPLFSPQKHVAFHSIWAWAQRDLAQLVFKGVAGGLDERTLRREAQRLGNLRTPRLDATARWYREWAREREALHVVEALDQVLNSTGEAPLNWTPSRPHLTLSEEGHLEYEERPDLADDAIFSFVNGLDLTGDTPAIEVGPDGAWNGELHTLLRDIAQRRLSFAGRTAVVTGGSPNSIAFEMVKHLLHGGARVILTTSTYNAKRLARYRALFQESAGRGAELHIVPFNQTSLQDIDRLVEWLFSAVTAQVGAEVKVIKRPFVPDILIPFAALKDLATVDTLGPRSQAALRTMLFSVERLIGGIAQNYKEIGIPQTPCHVVLPLSPNHGVFGGDGTYAETKAALEVLAHKWASERREWGACVTLCMARIGWVRGTGLMDANNSMAVELERTTGVRTFSNQEMATLLIALTSDPARQAALSAPLRADLTAGFDQIQDLKGVTDELRGALEVSVERAKARHRLMTLMDTPSSASISAPLKALPMWPLPTVPMVTIPLSTRMSEADGRPRLEDTIVIIGVGELGPCGTSRTRFELEVSDELSPAAILELAWTTGLIEYVDNGRGGGWVDVESGDEIPEHDIASTYRERVHDRVGIRIIDRDSIGFDSRDLEVMTSVFLERDMTFSVSSEDEARLFVEFDPIHTSATYDDIAELWKVTRRAGTEIRVPRKTRLNRYVIGQIPSGFDPARYGIPKDMVENTDRLTLFNLIATVDAFLSAGLTPEELLRWVHPARVANTQGCGIGGMESLKRLYNDPILDVGRQSDILQETLINVVAGYVVQSYVGSYGAMSHPVAACATAAVSLEEAFDKIQVGKADVVVAGGYDDIGRAGVLGFADMNATHNSDEMLDMGLEPHQFSRSNDLRRKGFVEAQGGGTFLVTRGDLALQMGTPVLAVVGYVGSYGDGIQKSVPAPGMGALSAAMGGQDSPLGRALRRYGLTADDIALAYKHDTSTNANDLNENRLHHQLQETLGRTEGNPLWVVSQKTLTGHSKGGAAAWQIGGMLQALASGVIPGNRNLDSVDPEMEQFGHMAFSDVSLKLGEGGLRAGVVTSLGFGHVSGLALLIHPGVFLELLSDEDRATYLERVAERKTFEVHRLASGWMGREALYRKRTHRRFNAQDGSAEQGSEERALLTDPQVRLRADATFGLEDL